MKQIFFSVIVAVTAILLCAGCGSSSNQSLPSETNTTTSTSVSAITLSNEPSVLYDSSTHILTLSYSDFIASSQRSLGNEIKVTLSSNHPTLLSFQPSSFTLSPSIPTVEVSILSSSLNETDETSYDIDIYADIDTKRYTVHSMKLLKNSDTSTYRTVTIKNECSGNIFVSYVGGAANSIACSPNTTQCTTDLVNQFGSDFKNWECKNFGTDSSPSYSCAPNTDANGSCPNGMSYDETIPGCACTSNSQCSVFSDGATCSANGVCNYAFLGSTLHEIESNNTITFKTRDINKTIVNSGKMNFMTGCDTMGQDCDQKAFMLSSPEFTLQSNGNDYYDYSYINGVTLPVSIEPVDENGKSLVPTTQESNKYFCGIAGATTDQTTTPGLQDYRCSYNYETLFDSNESGKNNIGFNFVAGGSETNCSTHADCTADGEVCGLSFETANNGGSQTTCGHRKGYWTYTGLCSMPNGSNYVNTNLEVNCSAHSDYALCLNSEGKDMVSGWGHTTNQCGCATWGDDNGSLNGLPGNLDDGQCDAPADWTTYIKPYVEVVKEGCPSNYSHQFDDPYSTFQCNHKPDDSINMTNYVITTCPGGVDNNLSFVTTPKTCTPSVASGQKASAFYVPLPDDRVTRSVYPCSNADDCNTSAALSEGNATYNTVSGTDYYLVQLTNKVDKLSQQCAYKITDNSCIEPVISSLNAPICSSGKWTVPKDSNNTWLGREIATQSFGPAPATCTPKSPVENTFNVGAAMPPVTQVNIKVCADTNESNCIDYKTFTDPSKGQTDLNASYDYYYFTATYNNDHNATCLIKMPQTECASIVQGKCDTIQFSVIDHDVTWGGRDISIGAVLPK